MVTHPFNAPLAIDGDDWNSGGEGNRTGEFGLGLNSDKSSR